MSAQTATVVGVVLAWAVSSGVHDTGTLTASASASRAIPPRGALALVCVFGFAGPLVAGTAPVPVPGPPIAVPADGALPYPVRLGGDLDAALSRWLWLVKWLLATPRLIALAFLWIAFAALTVVALAATS